METQIYRFVSATDNDSYVLELTQQQLDKYKDFLFSYQINSCDTSDPIKVTWTSHTLRTIHQLILSDDQSLESSNCEPIYDLYSQQEENIYDKWDISPSKYALEDIDDDLDDDSDDDSEDEWYIYTDGNII